MRAVGFNRDVVACIMESVNEFAGDEERRFATSEDHALGWILAEGGKDFVRAHHSVRLMFGVAERASQVAAREADENARRTCVEAFPLQGIENFVDGKHT